MPFEPTDKRFVKTSKKSAAQVLHTEAFVTSSPTMMFKVEHPLTVRWWDKDGGEGTIVIRPTLWEVYDIKLLAKQLGKEMANKVLMIEKFKAKPKVKVKTKKSGR